MNTNEKKNPILIDIPMPIETPRLILRNVFPGDGKAMFEAKAESFKELNRWMPWAKELGTEEASEIVVRENHAKFILREDIMIAGFEKTSGKFIIGTGLHRMDWERGIFEIGYYVRTSETGKGYASESTNALIRYAFNALAATKITICHVDGNIGSQRVIEKLGFEKTGYIADDGLLNDGTAVGRHWYARYDDKNLPELKVTW